MDRTATLSELAPIRDVLDQAPPVVGRLGQVQVDAGDDLLVGAEGDLVEGASVVGDDVPLEEVGVAVEVEEGGDAFALAVGVEAAVLAVGGDPEPRGVSRVVVRCRRWWARWWW